MAQSERRAMPAQSSIPKIFVSYRRQDTAAIAGRIYDRLRTHFGDDALFIDMDSIPFGVDFREHISQAVHKCGVMLAVIGPNWFGKTESGRRIDDLRDFVRVEVEVALERNLPVIPILIDRTTVPAETDLPPSLGKLAYRNAIDVDGGRDFHPHVDRLIKGIEYLFEHHEQAPASQGSGVLPEVGVFKESAYARYQPPVPAQSTPTRSTAQPNQQNPPEIRRPEPLAKVTATAREKQALVAVSQPQRLPPKWWKTPWLWVYLAMLPVLAILGVVINIVTDYGTVRITGTDPSMSLRIDNHEVRIENPGEPITLRPGPHDMLVTRGDLVVKTQTFHIQRGQETPLQVTYTPKPPPTTNVGPRAPAPLAEPKPTAVHPKREWTNSIGMKLVRIEPGEFLMGSPALDKDAKPNEKPQHRVWISRAFYLGVYEVTQGQYKAVMGHNPSYFQGSDDLPVEEVSWLHAVTFCNKLSDREHRALYYGMSGTEVTIAGGNGYRLPTEAEWEYACRAGSSSRYPFGDEQNKLSEHAWYVGNSANKTHTVGTKRPNSWGFYDMLGNVWEWCGDWYDERYYASSPSADPPGPGPAKARVQRGGGWDCGPPNASPYRGWIQSGGTHYNRLGFRVSRGDSG
jgi:formylglycine-generating enzyme required for sulfatase activity